MPPLRACEGREVQGQWSVKEQNLHINLLKLKAVLLALEHFVQILMNTGYPGLVRQLDSSCLCSESKRNKSSRQHANFWWILTFGTFGRMEHIIKSERCLLSYTDKAKISEILQVSFGKTSVSVHGNAFFTGNCIF